MYIGRFAPSPTGPLHFGSLIAAVASYCDARKNHGKWLVRIEDLDRPRTVKGAAYSILQQLESFGFAWDGPVLYQRQRDSFYNEALETLRTKRLIYPCSCTRKEIADSSTNIGIEGVIYPGTCLQQPIKPHAPIAWRIKTNASKISFEDAIQGKISQTLNTDIGDFILKRADGLFAYQLAVVVDDAAQGITNIVRGADLLDSTPRQIYLQKQLHYLQPQYAHIPVACNFAGEKLSKQTLARPISDSNANQLIYEALLFLGQQPPLAIKNATLTEMWRWACSNWQLASIPKLRNIPVTI
ncbi:MAG TPA: tRNA glutamyl-Q(34) synthetase GluQRS [Methylotenera sp.]